LFLTRIYVLFFFEKSNSREECYQNVLHSKETTSSEKLFSQLPAEFQHIFDYCNNLRFEEKPCYQYIKEKLKKMRTRKKFDQFEPLDWEKTTFLSQNLP
jgi:hypothetical protein